MFEVIVEPQEQPDQAQEERRENPAQGPSDPSSEQQPQGKPDAHPIMLNYDTYIHYYYLCIRFRNCLEP